MVEIHTQSAQSHIHREKVKVDIKARMLCYGVVADPEYAVDLANTYHLDRGFIHGTVFMLDGTDPVNTAFLDRLPGAQDPVRLIRDSNGPAVIQDGHRFQCEPLAQPRVLAKPLVDSTIGAFFSLHSPTTLFTAPVRQCIFITVGRPCTFCTFEGGKIRKLSLPDFERALRDILEESPSISAIAIGGGTPNLTDFGATYYGDLVSIAKTMGLSVSVEIVPPKPLERLLPLLSTGLDSLIMSIEIWDETTRRRVCLGKGDLARSHYLEAWSLGLERLGSGSVTSVLLTGIEPLRSTRDGIRELTSIGVIPALLPFREYADVRLRGLKPTTHKEYLSISQECGILLHRAGLDPRRQLGCTECGGCSLEILMYRNASEIVLDLD